MVTIDYENDGEKLVIYAMDEQSLFGKVICEPEEDEVYRLRDIYVSKDWRGQGYGRALVEAAHDIIGGYLGADELYAQFVRYEDTVPFYELLSSMGYKEKTRYASDVYSFLISDLDAALNGKEKLAEDNHVRSLNKCTRAEWTLLTGKISAVDDPVLLQDMPYYDGEHSSVFFDDNEEPFASLLLSGERKSKEMLIDCVYNGGSPKELIPLICKSYFGIRKDIGEATKVYANTINEQTKTILNKLTGGKLVKAGVATVMSYPL